MPSVPVWMTFSVKLVLVYCNKENMNMKIKLIIIVTIVFFILRKFIEILNNWVLCSDMTFEEKESFFANTSVLRRIFFVSEISVI